ncbi:ComX [Levilactobacillus senmaizukei DSM 21775 = NBRC 103853]|uniref:ComX n=1 Tax=Levilactobacillus senmaizukei DSM 21775 = NBRC 103853 TaxID=1423803 RepID=A0A0R2DEV1_9LACO|nr:sigma factor [Levilactobacillus senmaizukei]KRN02498.1 ComX [Levilactobacillus senmaizukei DSM 21775 = NBRC 103853]
MSDIVLIEMIRRTAESPALPVLFDRYRPVLLRLRQRYFIPGYDQDDWEQEALMVFCQVVTKFQLSRSVNFGAFYRLNLMHRVYDLIRQSRAQKRQCNRGVVSIDANGPFFADTLVDPRWVIREQLEVKEAVGLVQSRLSIVERVVFLGLVRGATLTEISRQERLTTAQATAAAYRCQAKLRRVLAE